MKKNKALGGHPIVYNVIPDFCDAKILYHDRSREDAWLPAISSPFGRINTFVDKDTGEEYKTLESLKAAGVRRVIITCEHILLLEEEDYVEANL